MKQIDVNDDGVHRTTENHSTANCFFVPESWVQKSWHLILQSRGGFASVLVPASVAIALLANGFHDEFVVFIIRGVVGVVDRRYVDFLLLVGDDGFGTNFGVGSGVHYVAPVTLQSAWQLAETFD